jgi:hypothetical protein
MRGTEENCLQILLGKPKERNDWVDLGVNGKVILKSILI